MNIALERIMGELSLIRTRVRQFWGESGEKKKLKYSFHIPSKLCSIIWQSWCSLCLCCCAKGYLAIYLSILEPSYHFSQRYGLIPWNTWSGHETGHHGAFFLWISTPYSNGMPVIFSQRGKELVMVICYKSPVEQDQ